MKQFNNLNLEFEEVDDILSQIVEGYPNDDDFPLNVYPNLAFVRDILEENQVKVIQKSNRWLVTWEIPEKVSRAINDEGYHPWAGHNDTFQYFLGIEELHIPQDLSSLKKGEFFKLKPTSSSPLWVRGDYERSSKSYSCYKYDDVNHERFFKGTKKVFTHINY